MTTPSSDPPTPEQPASLPRGDRAAATATVSLRTNLLPDSGQPNRVVPVGDVCVGAICVELICSLGIGGGVCEVGVLGCTLWGSEVPCHAL